jgi:deazaflavin-dependent oxidoreductase (nitroreductase family)
MENEMEPLRKIFKYLNKFFMVPALRLGLGVFICNPVSGYIMLIKQTGRKTGKLHFTPANYAIINGMVYCLAGFGRKADWFLNLKAHPEVELVLPGRAVFGAAEEVTDPHEALMACKQVFRSAGLAGFMEGCNPFTASDEEFLRTLKRAPVLRIQQTGIGSGPVDRGGWGWVTIWSGLLLLLWLVVRLKA